MGHFCKKYLLFFLIKVVFVHLIKFMKKCVTKIKIIISIPKVNTVTIISFGFSSML